MTFDITAAVIVHREGALAAASIRSLEAAAALAEAAGLTIERSYVLDRPDTATRSLIEQMCPAPWQGIILDAGDQGAARNHAAETARGQYIAFLDGDDLWGQSWLVRAHAAAAGLRPEAIIHPEFAYFFEGDATILRHVDQDDPEFDLDLLRAVNYWDGLCFCRTAIYRAHPYAPRDLARGWALEDWHWNCETLNAGYRHRIAPETVIFKRRRAGSQTAGARLHNALPRRSALGDYAAPIYRE
jgi:hypothetical protein